MMAHIVEVLDLKNDGYKVYWMDPDLDRLRNISTEELKGVRARIHRYIECYQIFRFDMQNDYGIKPFDCCDDTWYRTLKHIEDFCRDETKRRNGTLQIKLAYVRWNDEGRTVSDVIYIPNDANRKPEVKRMSKEELARMRTTRFYEYNGESYSIRQLMDIAKNNGNDIDYTVMYARLKSGWTVERAVKTPKATG